MLPLWGSAPPPDWWRRRAGVQTSWSLAKQEQKLTDQMMHAIVSHGILLRGTVGIRSDEMTWHIRTMRRPLALIGQLAVGAGMIGADVHRIWGPQSLGTLCLPRRCREDVSSATRVIRSAAVPE
jgi:hypothetical protein